jgi:hypothetical protein
MALEIQDLAWDKHKNVVMLNRLTPDIEWSDVLLPMVIDPRH